MNEVTVVTNSSKPLSKREWDRYNTLKEEIAEAISASFYKVGKALAEINESGLYREEFKTFEQCCQSLFMMGRQRAYQLMGASSVYELLSTVVDKTKLGESDVFINVLPINEAQIRPLLRVPEEDRLLVWSKTVETAKGGKPSSGHVNSCVKKYLGETFKTKLTNNQAKVDNTRHISAELKKAFDLLTEQIRLAKDEEYKTSSRLTIVMSLDGLRKIVAEDGDTIADRITGANRTKLLKAGYTFFRRDLLRLVIEKEDSSSYDWQMEGTYKSPELLDESFEMIIKESEMHLRD